MVVTCLSAVWLGLIAAPPVDAPEKPGVAVFDIEAMNGVSPGLAKLLTESLLTRLNRSRRFGSVIGGSDIRAMLDMEQKESTPLHDDSTAAISIVNSDASSARLRHLEIKWFFARELREAGVLRMVKIDTAEQIADHLSKALPVAGFKKHRDSLVTTKERLTLAAGAVRMYRAPAAIGCHF